MAQNLIRVKQLNTSELSGFVSQTVSSTGNLYDSFVSRTAKQTISGEKIFKDNLQVGDFQNAIYTDSDHSLIVSGYQSTLRTLKVIAASNSYETSITFGPGADGLQFKSPDYYFLDNRPKVEISNPYSIRPLALLDEVVLNTGNQTISGEKSFIKNTPFSSGSFKIYGDSLEKYNLEFSKSSRESATFSIVGFQKTAGSANPATVTTSQPHNFKIGDSVVITDIRTAAGSCASSSLNGSYIISNITSPTIFQYLTPGNDGGALGSSSFISLLTTCSNAPTATAYSYFSKSSSLVGDISLNSKNIISDSSFIISNGNLTVSGDIINSKIADQFPAWTGARRYPPLDFLSATAVIPVSGTVNYFPFLIKKNVVNPVVCVEMTIYLSSDPKIDIGIYSGDYGFQNAKLIASGSITGSVLNTGIYRTTLNGTFNKGPYIVASMLKTGQGSTFRALSSHGFREHFGISTGSNILHGVNNTFLSNVLAETGASALPQNIGSGEWYGSTAALISPLVFLEY